MESTLKDLRKFVIKEIINKNSQWSTEGRKEYYTTKYVSIKKNFDTDLWQFKLNGGIDKFFDLSIIDESTDNAILGRVSFEAGHIIISAFWIALTAFTVSSSTSPGPTPIPINPGMVFMPFSPIKSLD